MTEAQGFRVAYPLRAAGGGGQASVERLGVAQGDDRPGFWDILRGLYIVHHVLTPILRARRRAPRPPEKGAPSSPASFADMLGLKGSARSPAVRAPRPPRRTARGLRSLPDCWSAGGLAAHRGRAASQQRPGSRACPPAIQAQGSPRPYRDPALGARRWRPCWQGRCRDLPGGGRAKRHGPALARTAGYRPAVLRSRNETTRKRRPSNIPSAREQEPAYRRRSSLK